MKQDQYVYMGSVRLLGLFVFYEVATCAGFSVKC